MGLVPASRDRPSGQCRGHSGRQWKWRVGPPSRLGRTCKLPIYGQSPAPLAVPSLVYSCSSSAALQRRSRRHETGLVITRALKTLLYYLIRTTLFLSPCFINHASVSLTTGRFRGSQGCSEEEARRHTQQERARRVSGPVRAVRGLGRSGCFKGLSSSANGGSRRGRSRTRGHVSWLCLL